MQVVLFLVLKESSAGAVDDGLWQTGCAAGVEDVKGLGGRQLGEVKGLVRRAAEVSVYSKTHSGCYRTCSGSR